MKRAISIVLMLGIGLLLTPQAFAQTSETEIVDLSWTAPTQRDDGTALTNLAGFKVYWGTTSREYQNVVDLPSPEVVTYTVEGLSPGTTYYFAATAYDSDGLESVYSTELVLTTRNAAPMPPGNFVISEGDRTAYLIQESRNKITLVQVGVVRADTVCDAAQTVMGMHVVPRDAVIWFGDVQPEVVVAQCDG